MSQCQREGLPPRRRFTEELKCDSVRLIVEQGYTFKAAAAAVGVSEQSLRGWHARLAPPAQPCGGRATLDELGEENTRKTMTPVLFSSFVPL